MAGESNGRPVEPGQKGANKGANGHAVGGPRTKIVKTKNGSSLVSIITRILTWYSIITIAFRCPQSVDLLTESSPKICKPYFQAKSVLAPHLTPYYNTYAAPYVEAARPYYNTVDQKVITPATDVGKKYLAPRLAQAQSYGQAQWQKTLQPEVLKFQGIAKQKYDESLAPHVDKLVTATSPYLDIARTNALQTYYGHILPTYNTVQPYAQRSYGVASDFAVNTGIPYAQWAWTTGNIFLDRTIWPKLRILYGENVEPQLVRIGERLGRYRDGKKLKAAVDGVDSSASSSSASSSLSSVASSVAAAHGTVTESTSSTSSSTADIVSPSPEPENTPLTEAEIIAKAQKIVQADLKNWQKKWAKAADEGSDELDARITEITDRLVQSQAEGVGKALIIQLEETIKSSLKSLKSDIVSVVKKSTDNQDKEEAEEQISTAVRKAGVAIKDKAQAVRTWRQKYDQETNYLVSQAAHDTFQIIDTIRDVGLQEIGMRWAWTDGITHKDWAKYHALKSRFDEWRGDVEKVATEHPGLDKARVASEEVESQAMGLAEEAAKELASIKETGRWKLFTGDTSDDYTPNTIPAKVAKAAASASSLAASQASNAQSAASSLSASVIGTPQGNAESVISVGSASASSLADQISSSIIGTEQGTLESVASGINSAVDQASSSVIGTSTGNAESLASDAAASASSFTSKIYTNAESAASAASDAAPIESASSFSDAVSSSLSSVGSVAPEEASSVSGSISSYASSVSSQASKSVWGGAMAQHVEARKIVYEDVVNDSDDDTFSEKIQSMASEAGDKFADITKAVSEALLKPTSTQGTAESVTSLAAEQYSSALAAASSVLYGTQQGTGESIASVASSRYADAVAAASAAIYGTPLSPLQSISSAASSAYYGPPTGALESISSVAASRLSEGLSVASAQFSSAKASIGPAQTPLAQKYLLQAENQFYAGVGIAHARYSQFLEAASSAVLPTQIPFHQSVLHRASESILGTQQGNVEYATSVAQEHYSKATAAASASLDAVLSSLSSLASTSTAAPTASLLSQASSRYSAAIAKASSSYESISSVVSDKAYEAASQASSAVIGSETPWTESVASQASENWEALVTKASEQIYGAPTPYYITKGYTVPGSLYSQATDEAGILYGQATDRAISQYEAMQSLVSELVSGKEAPYTESVYSRFSSAYATGAFAAASSASSYASEAYASATSVAGDTLSSANSIVGDTYSSASSAVAGVFTPPPALESILDSASSRVNDAVEAASVQFYGSQKGTYEQATSSAASIYSSAQSVASEKIYGSSTGYVDSASSSIADAAASAQSAISEAIYGTPTGTVESVTNVVGETYASATSVLAENISSAHVKASSLIYGPEKGAVESAQSRLTAAVESARAKLADFASTAGDGASDAVKKASEGVEEFASSVSSAVDAATSYVKKDEL